MGERDNIKMIRINLLPEKKKRRRVRRARYYFILCGIITLTTLLIAVATTYYIRASISSLKSERDANNATIASLSKKISESKKYEQLNKEISQRNALIENLRSNQALPTKMLNNVAMALPEGVWIGSLVYKDEGVDIEGYAFTNISVVTYVENLKRYSDLTDVYLVESKEAELETVRVYKFKIVFKLKV